MKKEPSLCTDCGVETTPCTGRRGCRHAGKWEYYMVWHDVWRESGMGDGFLCIGCLEVRLGRRLTPKDFSPLPINDRSPWDTERLRQRKSQVDR